MRIDRKKLEINRTRKMAKDKMDSMFCNQYIITKWNGLNKPAFIALRENPEIKMGIISGDLLLNVNELINIHCLMQMEKRNKFENSYEVIDKHTDKNGMEHQLIRFEISKLCKYL